jgi:hypothetical protein
VAVEVAPAGDSACAGDAAGTERQPRKGLSPATTPIAYTQTELAPGCSGTDPENPCCPLTPIAAFTSARGLSAIRAYGTPLTYACTEMD